MLQYTLQLSPASWGFVAGASVCLLLYLLNVVVSETGPSTWWGFGYGAASAVLMGGTALYGLRRRTRPFMTRYGLGTTHAWLQFHLYGGLLALLLMLMHTRFTLPTGSLNWWLWALTLWVSLSGLVGVALQKWIPRALSSGLSIEAIYERIPELTEQISGRADTLAATCEAPVRRFYESRIAPTLSEPRMRFIYFLDITGGIRSELREFEFLKEILGPEERDRLDQLEGLYKTKLELDAHFTLQGALRGWAAFHVPASLLLLALLGWHLFSAWYY